MKKFFGIFGIGIVLSFVFGINAGGFDPAGFGIAELGLGVLCFFIGFVMLIAKEKDWAKYFLLSGLTLFLIGVTTCSTVKLNIR